MFFSLSLCIWPIGFLPFKSNRDANNRIRNAFDVCSRAFLNSVCGVCRAVLVAQTVVCRSRSEPHTDGSNQKFHTHQKINVRKATTKKQQLKICIPHAHTRTITQCIGDN